MERRIDTRFCSSFPARVTRTPSWAAEQVKIAGVGGIVEIKFGELTVGANLTKSKVQIDKTGPVDLSHLSDMPPQTVSAMRAGCRLF